MEELVELFLSWEHWLFEIVSGACFFAIGAAWHTLWVRTERRKGRAGL